jgi:hypothetical protein
VLEATVPEAPVNKHGNACSGEHNVGSATECDEGTNVETITKAPAVKGLSKSNLTSRVPLCLGSHSLLYDDTRGRRHTASTVDRSPSAATAWLAYHRPAVSHVVVCL